MNILSKVTGLNWYKWGAILVAFLAWSAIVYTTAQNRCELKHEQQKTEQAEKKAEQLVDEVEKRVPEVKAIDAESAKLKNEIARLKGELDEAINNRPENPSCDLSGDELDGFNNLFKKTRPAE